MAFNPPNMIILNGIRRTGIVLLGLLAILILYLTWIQIVRHDQLAGSSLNRFNNSAVMRGRIMSADGSELAVTDKNGRRVYPLGMSAATVTGYDSKQYGKSGIEAIDNRILSGADNPWRDMGPAVRLFGIERGDDVKLTIKADLQQAAYSALGNHRGAVIMLDVNTGAILAMASRPIYNPSTISDDWGSFEKSDDGRLMNRAVQGLYPPGSTIKILTAEAAITDGIAKRTTVFDDSLGYLKVGNYTLWNDDKEVHGQINLEQALTVSSNVVFGMLGIKLGGSGLQDAFHRFGFYQELNAGLDDSMPILPDFKKLADGELAQTAIGQGGLLVTPLRMVLLTATMANGGDMPFPYLTASELLPGGEIVWQAEPRVWQKATKPEVAAQIADMMCSVVQRGTGRGAAGGVAIGGKTGTAENPHGPAHSWFIGFAPVDKPQVAIAVIVENAGYGSEYAVPIGGQLLNMAVE